MASNTADPVEPLVGRFPGYDDTFLASIDKAMSVLPKHRMQTARQWSDAITGGPAAKTAPKTVELSRTVTPMTRVTRFEAEAARKKIGPIAIVGGLAVLALVATGVYLAMPGGSGAGSAATPAIGKASAAVTAHADPADAKTGVAPAEVATAAATPVVEEPAVTATKPAPAEPAVTAAAEPAAPAPAAEPQVTAVSALTSNWMIDLPFAAAADAPTTVSTVQGVVPDWLAPGVKILSVNGTPISNLPEIAAVLRETQDPKDAAAITATVSMEGPGGAAEQTIDLPVVHRVILVSGAEFQSKWVDGVWRTEVTQLPDGYNGEVRIGDVIVGHVNSGLRMTGPNDLKTALEGEIISGNRSTTLAVQQGGQMWVVTFPLPG